MSFGNSFYQFVAGHYRQPVTFDAEAKNGTLIRSTLPIERFEKEIDDAIKIDPTLRTADRQQMLVIKLLAYFKNEFFSWVDALDCPACTTKCVLHSTQRANTSELIFLATNVEVYRCPSCGTHARFPRYNDPRKLLITRQGRCGEWANTFAYILHCLDIATRLVYCTSDHVWVEFYNKTEKRWIHTDPCENAIDNPLIYEIGWGKKMDLVVARGEFELRDVTWRYTAEWRVTAQDRARMLDEQQLLQVFNQWNVVLQARLSSEQILDLQKRWIEELVEFIRMPDQEVITPGTNAAIGRQSGSLAWRLSRAEIGAPGTSCTTGSGSSTGHTFKLPCSQSGKVMITYDCSLDSYRLETFKEKSNAIPNETSVISKWNSGVASFENIQRKTEHDWAMTYLARREGSLSSDTGIILWKFEDELVEGEEQPKWTSIDVQINGQTYENGSVTLTLTLGQFKRCFQLNEKLHITREEVTQEGGDNGLLAFQIEARLGGGSGNVAYQHAQIFRQKLCKDREDTFKIVVNYK